jgi:hypothetical protein
LDPSFAPRDDVARRYLVREDYWFIYLRSSGSGTRECITGCDRKRMVFSKFHP